MPVLSVGQMATAGVKWSELRGDVGCKLVRCTDGVDQFGRPTPAQTCSGRHAVADEGIKAADEVGTDRVEMLRLTSEHPLEAAACKELVRGPSIFESDLGDRQIEAVIFHVMPNVWRRRRRIGVVIGLGQVKLPFLHRRVRRQLGARILKPAVRVRPGSTVHIDVDAMQAVGTVASSVLLAIDERFRPCWKDIGNCLAEQIALVGVKYGACFAKARLVLQAGKSELGRAVKHRRDSPNAVRNREEIGGVIPVEMLLNVKAKPGKPGAKSRMDVAPIVREKLGR